MTVEATALRNEFKNSLLKLVNSDLFKLIQQKYGLQEYKIDVLSNKYRDGAIDILNQQFSDHSGGNILDVSVNILPGDINWSGTVDYAIKGGISLIIVDKNDEVCYVSIREDMSNEYQPPVEEEKQNASKKFKVILDICEQISSENKWYKNNILNKKNKKIGRIVHGFVGAVRQNVTGNNIFKFAMCVSCAMLVDVKHVKYYYGEPTHPATIHWALKSRWFFNNILCKGLETSDNDGYFVILGTLNVLNYFKDKFANDEWFRNNFNEREVFQRLNRFQKHEILSWHLNYEKMRKKYTAEQVFELYVNFLFKPKSQL
eukprot:445092_1